MDSIDNRMVLKPIHVKILEKCGYSVSGMLDEKGCMRLEGLSVSYGGFPLKNDYPTDSCCSFSIPNNGDYVNVLTIDNDGEMEIKISDRDGLYFNLLEDEKDTCHFDFCIDSVGFHFYMKTSDSFYYADDDINKFSPLIGEICLEDAYYPFHVEIVQKCVGAKLDGSTLPDYQWGLKFEQCYSDVFMELLEGFIRSSVNFIDTFHKKEFTIIKDVLKMYTDQFENHYDSMIDIIKQLIYSDMKNEINKVPNMIRLLGVTDVKKIEEMSKEYVDKITSTYHDFIMKLDERKEKSLKKAGATTK